LIQRSAPVLVDLLSLHRHTVYIYLMTNTYRWRSNPGYLEY